ncbi:hypothetical protein TNCV_1147141 [Trichonephila clavipes]|nr:hypothetical protein TNCV_1147141 [Trichonephila clavipes]
MFTPLPAETCPAVETETFISNTIDSTSQDAKQISKSRKKRRPKRSITSKIDIQLTPHKPKKSTPLQDTLDEDMLIYDVKEEVESPKILNSAARTLLPITIRELRLALQDEWAAMSQQPIDTLILSMGRRCETFLAVRGDHIPY